VGAKQGRELFLGTGFGYGALALAYGGSIYSDSNMEIFNEDRKVEKMLSYKKLTSAAVCVKFQRID
jgi:hypothetical protein